MSYKTIQKTHGRFGISKSKVIQLCRTEKILLSDYPQFLNIKEVVIEAVKNNGENYLLIPENFKYDRKMVLDLLQNNGSIIMYIPEVFRNETEIISLAEKTFPNAILYGGNELKKNREWSLESLKKNYKFLFYSGRERDEEFLLTAFEVADNKDSSFDTLLSLITREHLLNQDFLKKLISHQIILLEIIPSNYLNKEILFTYSEYIKSNCKKESSIMKMLSEYEREDELMEVISQDNKEGKRAKRKI